jgi:tryptophan-rich sensory protein
MVVTSRSRPLVLSLAASALVAGIGAAGSRNAPQVYGRLSKPPWAPPAEAFGPVWTVLYAAIGVAGGRLARTPDARLPVGLHAAQLALNAAWSPVFFAAGRRRTALAILLGLDVTVTAELVTALRRDRTAAALLAPYLGWLLYATALNAAVADQDGPSAPA